MVVTGAVVALMSCRARTVVRRTGDISVAEGTGADLARADKRIQLSSGVADHQP